MLEHSSKATSAGPREGRRFARAYAECADGSLWQLDDGRYSPSPALVPDVTGVKQMALSSPGEVQVLLNDGTVWDLAFAPGPTTQVSDLRRITVIGGGGYTPGATALAAR